MQRFLSTKLVARLAPRALHTSSRLAAAVPRLPAPAFTAPALMPDGSFKTLSLADYLGKWVVLVTYPLDWTYVCPSELTAFSDRAKEFHELGAEVLVMSTDSKESHLAWTLTPRAQGGVAKMAVPMLSDLTHRISKAYGVLIENEADPDCGIALRGSFVIDPKGVVRAAYVNDLPVGRSVDETLRVVQAFQHIEKNGVVCPANWKPGARTMVDKPAESKQYFQAVHSPGH